MCREFNQRGGTRGRRFTQCASVLLASGAAVCLLPAYAQAEEAVDEDPAAIIVTAEKRAESINDVGMAVQAISSEDLVEAGVSQMSDLSQLAAGVHFRDARPGGNPVITMRGVGLNDYLISSNPSVAVYYDGVYSPSLGTISGQFFDLERVEVLKGPQSALYGRNATGGVINVVSARPTDYLTGYATVTLGNYETVQAEGAISGPLGDHVSGRLSVRTDQRFDGYMTNLYQGGQELGTIHKTDVRGQILAEPTENLTLHAIVSYGHENSTPGAWTSFGRRDPDDTSSFCAADIANKLDFANECVSVMGYRRESTDPYTTSENDRWDLQTDVYNATFIATYEGDGFAITSTTGYLDWSQDRYQSDSLPITEDLARFEQSVWQLSQDLQIASNGNSPFQWLGGVYLSSGNTVLDLYYTSGVSDAEFLLFHDADTRTVQPYVQLDYAFSPMFSLSAGARYIHEYNNKVGAVYNDLNTNGVPDADDVTFAELDDSMKQDHLTYKVAAKFTPADDTLFYASYTHGFKSGGYSATFVSNVSGWLPYGGEKIDAYEVGVKQGLGGIAQFNASLFYYDYSDIQTNTTVIVENLASSRFDNIDSATVKGADIDLTVWPVEGLTLKFGVGLLDTEVGEYLNANGDMVAKGNRLPNAPKFSGTASFRYETPISDNVDLRLSGSVEHHSKYYFDVDNEERIASDSEGTLVDASIGLMLPNEGIDISIWSKNLLNETYGLSGFSSNSFVAMYYNMPRTYGVTVSKNF